MITDKTLYIDRIPFAQFCVRNFVGFPLTYNATPAAAAAFVTSIAFHEAILRRSTGVQSLKKIVTAGVGFRDPVSEIDVG